MENYQTPEGVNVPECLQPYMNGIKFIPYNEKKVKKWREDMEKEDKKAADKKAAGGGKKKGKGGEDQKKEEKPKKEAGEKKAPAGKTEGKPKE